MTLSNETRQAALRGLFAGNSVDKTDMYRSCQAVLGSLPMVAQALLKIGDKPVKVRHGFNAAGCTDGETIYLMDMPIPTSSGDIDTFVQMLALSYGLLHHEVGHVVDTDFEVFDAGTTPGKPREFDPLVRTLTNIVEDIRQENVHIKRFPAARRYLDALIDALRVRGDYAGREKPSEPTAIFVDYVLIKLRHDYRNNGSLSDLLAEYEQLLAETFPKAVQTKLEVLLTRCPELEDTRDAYALADDIRGLLEEIAEEQENQPQETNGQGQNGQDQQSASGAQPNANQDSGQASSQGAGQGQSSGPTCADASVQSGAGNTQGSDPMDATRKENLQKVLHAEDIAKALGDVGDHAREALKAVSSSIRNEGSTGTLRNWQEILDQSLEEPKAGEAQGGADYDMAKALSVTSKLRIKLLKELQAEIDSSSIVGRRGQRLSGRHLHRVHFRDDRVFRRDEEEVELDTAVVLLQDTSGSMSDNGKIEMASQAVYAAAVAVEALEGVRVAVATFPNFVVVKEFRSKALRKEESMCLYPGGSTPMGQGILLGTRLLHGQEAKRKLLVVATDGEPDDRGLTEIMVQSALRSGIEVYGLGIVDNAGEGIFPNWRSIQSIEDLPTTMIQLLQQRLYAIAA